MTRLPIPVGLLRQFAGYVGIGGIAFVCDFAMLTLVVKALHGGVLWGATAGFIVGAIVNYALCVKLVFNNHTLQSRWLEFAIFVAIGLVGLAINDLVMVACIKYAGLQFQIAKLIAAAVVLVFNFAGRRTVLFSQARSHPGLVATTRLHQESV
ncbi:GtrA family protein [Amantichitinum ursilacus]|uniref:GtrA-like protein n=1 Tax=Amantichitinum ursilacus TaxID=857265 RepID=A0A0N1JSI6_9NEIS|nr:GtrA family protein [Amantichitinum ursilacus]KPC52267.1 GtrA-like protein [Amantichitinum ursilacus]